MECVLVWVLAEMSTYHAGTALSLIEGGLLIGLHGHDLFAQEVSPRSLIMVLLFNKVIGEIVLDLTLVHLHDIAHVSLQCRYARGLIVGALDGVV